MAKLIENTFRQVNIALVNELAVLARDLWVDIWEALRAASTKSFGYMPFWPGPGVGGHCIAIDPSYLSWRTAQQTGYHIGFIEHANEVINRMPHYVVNRIGDALNDAGKPCATLACSRSV
jgi:UDP-N-acetyl-D-glucosamine dehydrogenase